MDGVIRVLVVDDDPLVRSALTLMLGGQADIDVVGEAGNGEAGLALVTELSPDVVLMDIRMPGTDGLRATREIAADPELAGVHVLILTTFDHDEYVVEALGAGAAGFLIKNIKYAVLITFVVSAVITPTADPGTQTVFALPMVLLYILSIGIAWLVAPRKPAAES